MMEVQKCPESAIGGSLPSNRRVRCRFDTFSNPGHSIIHNVHVRPAKIQISIRCRPEDALDSWLPRESPAKTLIRLRGCAVGFESAGRTCSLVENAVSGSLFSFCFLVSRIYVFSASNIFKQIKLYEVTQSDK